MKCFNTAAVCIPSKHYMVDLSERAKEIKKLVDDGKYFAINRARQYGKTTTLDALQDWCYEVEKDIVLIIDEVDSATNNQVFIDFLAGLRDNYINRDLKDIKTFKSVILAGVTDVKHLKSKIRPEDDRKENSPWNIAADFTIDMSLSEDGIKGMLDEYESDHHTGMDTAVIAKSIREYTNGYPFLVSRICKLIDESVSKTVSLSEAWTRNGIDEAVKLILAENNTLFQSLTKFPPFTGLVDDRCIWDSHRGITIHRSHRIDG